MPNVLKTYVRWVDAFNRAVGRFVMYVLLFAMMGILLYSTIAGPVFDRYPIWSVEMAQFVMAAYYLLGGGYSMQLQGHVRMDVLYSRWSPRTQAMINTVTNLLLIFYLVILLSGAVSGIDYALEYNQRNYTAWAPPLAPIKIIMGIGILMMLLQSLSTVVKDIAVIRGEPIEEGELVNE
ncbi:MAG: TRAP transporter small permease subunit [Ectothiorhodospiraceae bacterium]